MEARTSPRRWLVADEDAADFRLHMSASVLANAARNFVIDGEALDRGARGCGLGHRDCSAGGKEARARQSSIACDAIGNFGVQQSVR